MTLEERPLSEQITIDLQELNMMHAAGKITQLVYVVETVGIDGKEVVSVRCAVPTLRVALSLVTIAARTILAELSPAEAKALLAQKGRKK